MESNDQRPNAALINKEWFSAASAVLSRSDLAEVVLRSVEYVFGVGGRVTANQQVDLVFAMVRPALDSDIVKYRERCARNAANARSHTQRVAASGTQSQPVGANTTTTTTPTTTPTTTQSLSEENEEERLREKFNIFGYFWSVGSTNPKEELHAFWSYYESLGWKNNKGAPVINKIACARMWRRQFETRPPKQGAAEWFRAFSECKIPDVSVFVKYMGAECVDDEKGLVHVNMWANEPFLKSIEEKAPECLEMFRRSIKAERVELVAV